MRRDFRKWMHEQDYQFMERIIHEKRTTGDVTFQGEPIFGPDPEYPQEA
jgi:hypothetical protein